MNLRKLLTTNLSGLALGRDFDTSVRRKTVDWKGPHYARKRLRSLDLLFVTDQLGGLVRANAPMVQGITDALSLDAPNNKVEAVLLTLRDDLAAGLSLTEAMRLRPRFFPGPYVDLVSAGELAGSPGAVFDELSRELDDELSARGTWAGYIAYALVVVVIQLLILAFLSIKVVPVFYEILEDFGAEIPFSLSALSEFSDFLGLNWRGIVTVLVLYLAASLVLYMGGGLTLLAALTRHAVPRIPFVRGWVRKREIATASAFLSRAIGAGVPLDEALGRVDTLSLQPRLRAAFVRLGNRVSEGENLADTLNKDRKVWPESFVSWLTLGERSAMLPEAFGEIAENYRQQVLKIQSLSARVVAPLTILIAGGFSLLGAAACYQATTSLVNLLLDQL